MRLGKDFTWPESNCATSARPLFQHCFFGFCVVVRELPRFHRVSLGQTPLRNLFLSWNQCVERNPHKTRQSGEETGKVCRQKSRDDGAKN